MSTTIYLTKLEPLTWGNEFAQALSDASYSESDLISIDADAVERMLKKAPAGFRKEYSEQLAAVRKAIKASKYQTIDVWVSW
jgi:hypothetical protein